MVPNGDNANRSLSFDLDEQFSQRTPLAEPVQIPLQQTAT
jgi:hypothetical protein